MVAKKNPGTLSQFEQLISDHIIKKKIKKNLILIWIWKATLHSSSLRWGLFNSRHVHVLAGDGQVQFITLTSDGCIPPRCVRSKDPMVCMLFLWDVFLGYLTVRELTLMLSVTPVLFLRWQVCSIFFFSSLSAYSAAAINEKHTGQKHTWLYLVQLAWSPSMLQHLKSCLKPTKWSSL